MRVLLTRNPLHNMLLRQAIEVECHHSEMFILEAPLLEQVPVTDSIENLQQFLQDKTIQDVIFISPSSVDFGAEKVLQEIELQRMFAVGKGTANLLRTKLSQASKSKPNENNAAVEVLFPKTNAGSEALLQLPEMQAVDSRQILIVTGSEGKPYLEKQLLKRGANVCRWECYERQKPKELAQQMAKILEHPLDVVFLHSAHAAKHFLEEIPNGYSSDSMVAIVGAKSIAEELAKNSWPGSIKVANSPMPRDMLKVFKQC